MSNAFSLQNKLIGCVESQYLTKNADYLKPTLRFYKEGFEVLQVINRNSLIINELKEACPDIQIVSGGNINSIKKALKYFDRKSDYIVVGRFLAKNLDCIKDWINLFGQHLIISIDDKGGVLANNGRILTEDFAKLLAKNKVKNVVYVSENTKLVGKINLEGFKKIRHIIKNAVIIYSGGVSSLDDLRILKKAGADAVIIGTALYQKKFNYAEAKRVFGN
ncbi:MAG: HisA/HisF-related TIM barrel protein [Candidatus Gottesmanbacteria bacterium]